MGREVVVQVPIPDLLAVLKSVIALAAGAVMTSAVVVTKENVATVPMRRIAAVVATAGRLALVATAMGSRAVVPEAQMAAALRGIYAPHDEGGASVEGDARTPTGR